MKQILPLGEEELQTRIEKNYARLCEPYYQIDEVFQDFDCDWPGDKEGRALLAFVCQYEMTGKKIPCMEEMMSMLDKKTNVGSYFGPAIGDPIFEQQLSGHSWFLRGLCEYYDQFGGEDVLQRLRRVFEGLYLPTAGHYTSYPVIRTVGAESVTKHLVSGESALVLNGWLLSSDIGCAFMSIDGLSHYYTVTRDARAKSLLDEMITVFCGIDKFTLQAQTHCSLTAARGMLRMYEATGEQGYLAGAQGIWQLYLDSGMTATYQNFNWWNRGNTWTEPCAIVDSLILALWLHKLTKEEKDLTMARRIWHNGMASAQRPNGGAGPDSTVSANTTDSLCVNMYEAFFCCTMRLSEGLLWAQRNADLLAAVLDGEISKDALGRWHDGDILYGEITSPVPESLPERSLTVQKDGHTLTPLVKYYRLTQQEAQTMIQKILF